MGSFDPGIKFLPVNMVTNNILLSVLFVSGALADCPKDPGLFITAPKKMEALSGSCLLIPCYFRAEKEQEFDNSRETFGVWIKSDSRFGINPNNVVFNSTLTVNIYTMNITGNLRQKNCTTLFYNLLTSHSDKYYFRIENKPFMATASCDPLQISVKDSPASPRIEISGDLKEKESVTITCSALTPCPHSPPKLTWNLQQHSHNKIEENTDRSFTTKIQKNITLTDKHDGYNITLFCHISCERRCPRQQRRQRLSVFHMPPRTPQCPSVHQLWCQQVAGCNLTCSSRAKPPVSRFTWFKTSTDGPMKNLPAGQLAVKEPARATEIEDIHYGEISFSKHTSQPSSSVQDSVQQQDTLYAQVKLSKTANRLPQTADGKEDIYAKVKQK
ncbi:hypothetical protein L3Q82_004602 [Scortum barcoo]|uniref:Uncharacterized protein n=1 Tax=Scortum barcoo TaxID=214431 RepID=A0ACB8VGN9_9TELE|nr:hypothetical protein L3Q82_004602 [Scortum barcoo]